MSVPIQHNSYDTQIDALVDAHVRALTFGASGLGHSAGTVPDPGAVAGTVKFLREDGTWQTPAGGGTVTAVTASVPVASSGGATPNITITDFVGSGVGHARGTVPDPGAAAGTTKFLREDGSWQVPAGGGTVTAVTASSPLASSGGATPNLTIALAKADGATLGAAAFATNDFNDNGSGIISIDYTNGQAADSTHKGFLTSTDWSTFNGKQAALGFTPVNKAGDTNIGSLNINGAGSGGGEWFSIQGDGSNNMFAVIDTGAATKVMIDNLGAFWADSVYTQFLDAGTANGPIQGGFIQLGPGIDQGGTPAQNITYDGYLNFFNHLSASICVPYFFS